LSFEVIDEKTNRLIGRREAKLVVHHEGAGTPDRLTVRKLASDHFKTPVERVFVRSISTRTGGSSALCAVEIYDDKQVAQKVVPAYLKNRNLPKEQRLSKAKKGEESKPTRAPEPAPEKAGKATAKEAKPAAEKTTKPAEKEAKTPPKPEARPKA
jgi:ribosomal protein S24E